jgi:hypothetical protein
MPDEQPIKPVENYSRMPVGEVITRGLAVADKMDGNPKLPRPPVRPADLRAAVVRLQALQAEILGGSKKVFAERDKQLDEVIKMMRLQGRYVEITAGRDMETFVSSGFEPAPPNTKAQSTLSEYIWSLDHGPNSGEIIMRLKAVAGAYSYQFRYGKNDEDPELWMMKPVTRVKTPIVISGLTPAMTYGFQVRALLKDGYTDWSDPVTFMCT